MKPENRRRLAPLAAAAASLLLLAPATAARAEPPSPSALQLVPLPGKKLTITQQPGASFQITERADGLELQCQPGRPPQPPYQQPGSASDLGDGSVPGAPSGLGAGTGAGPAEDLRIVSRSRRARPEESSFRQAPGSAARFEAAESGVSRREAPREERSGGALADEVIGLIPQAGDVNFRDQTGAIANRGVAGVGFEANFTPGSAVFLGLSSGLLASRVGTAGATFFGHNGTSPGDGAASLLLIPADLKLALSLGSLRFGVHGGGNVIRRSSAQAVALSTPADGSAAASWTLLPNAGADLELALGSHAAIVLRPDATFASGNRLLAATLGLLISLG